MFVRLLVLALSSAAASLTLLVASDNLTLATATGVLSSGAASASAIVYLRHPRKKGPDQA
ncbi:hypothetical protein ACIG3E_32675 [Streptomyces sp. NPDC053474]|uniref:hypothetical protein n=1 Tax=Streptomyces sp. NPDC053474 TaxID=3365704 RepID=UPI0037D8E740